MLTTKGSRTAGLTAATGELISRLLRSTSCLASDDLAPLLRAEAKACGFGDATMFLADYEQLALIPVCPLPDEAFAQDIDTTLAGRAFQVERPVYGPSDEAGAGSLWLPLIDSAERLGVLCLRSPAWSEELEQRCVDVASLVAELIVAKARYGDSLTLVRRQKEMTLAAELRWAQLPPLTFTAERVGIACVLEPPTK